MYVYLYAIYMYIYMLCVRVWLCFYKVSFNYKPFCQRAFRVLSSKSGGLVFSPKLRLFVWESHEQPSQYREGGSIQVLLGLQGLVPMGGGKGPESSGICWSSSNRSWSQRPLRVTPVSLAIAQDRCDLQEWILQSQRIKHRKPVRKAFQNPWH